MLRCRGLGGQGEAPLVPLAAERRTARHALVPVPKEARLRVDRLWRGARGEAGGKPQRRAGSAGVRLDRETLSGQTPIQPQDILRPV